MTGMTPIQIKFYKRGRKNKEFIAQLKQSDPNYIPIHSRFGEGLKINFAMVYFGWLIGRGEFNLEDYE